ncbi:hypothetical protein [Streptomyces pini]|uniref:Uncharacterized protein n=1 Tax=Streptomyces pini TaxID=1520580 RepID=A0A1I3UCT7_9ACTN|nr:hypothetical protein [Streptomyces pini]SFJ80810.1 hypothetical protein SAMN05192584_101418 [Streptomyces pini]
MKPSPPLRAHRFRDRRHTKYDFLDPILVACPGCGTEARVAGIPHEPGHPLYPALAPRRLVCRACALSRTRGGGGPVFHRSPAGTARDPYFGAPLLLQTRTRHGLLWAYNLRHLDLIERYVRASLRERAHWYDIGTGKTLVASLPVWIKRGRNRDEILRAVRRARARTVPPESRGAVATGKRFAVHRARGLG